VSDPASGRPAHPNASCSCSQAGLPSHPSWATTLKGQAATCLTKPQGNQAWRAAHKATGYRPEAGLHGHLHTCRGATTACQCSNSAVHKHSSAATQHASACIDLLTIRSAAAGRQPMATTVQSCCGQTAIITSPHPTTCLQTSSAASHKHLLLQGQECTIPEPRCNGAGLPAASAVCVCAELALLGRLLNNDPQDTATHSVPPRNTRTGCAFCRPLLWVAHRTCTRIPCQVTHQRVVPNSKRNMIAGTTRATSAAPTRQVAPSLCILSPHAVSQPPCCVWLI
jgi:hypothetical protein